MLLNESLQDMKADKPARRSYRAAGTSLGRSSSRWGPQVKAECSIVVQARDVMGLNLGRSAGRRGGWENYLDEIGRSGLSDWMMSGEEGRWGGLEGTSGFSFGSWWYS